MQRSEKRTARATALIALSACGFGSISTLTTIVIRGGTPLVPAMFWRYAAGFVVLTPIIIIARRSRLKFSLALLLVGGVGQALVTYVSLKALDYISVAPLAFLFYTYPAWVTLVSAARGIDKVTPSRAAALVIALAGVAVIIGSPFHMSLNATGVALALAAAVIYGFYVPALSVIQRDTEPMIAALHIIVGAAIVFGAVALGDGALSLHFSRASAAGIAALGIGCTVGAFWLFLAGLSMLGPMRTAIVSTLEPFYTALLGAAVLHESLSVRTIAGGSLIAAAVIIIQRSGADVVAETTAV